MACRLRNIFQRNIWWNARTGAGIGARQTPGSHKLRNYGHHLKLLEPMGISRDYVATLLLPNLDTLFEAFSCMGKMESCFQVKWSKRCMRAAGTPSF